MGGIINSDKTIHFHPEMLENASDIVSDLGASDDLADIVHIYDVSDRKCMVYNDVANEHLLITY
jgi:hypothetical protein